MKCKYCGSNLEIDNAFCPYCGKENPVAKKHREDMAAYSKEYADTKKEVIDNSRKFNKKNFKLTVIMATVAAVLAVLMLGVFCEDLSYDHYRNERIRRTKRYVGEVEQYIEEADVIALADLVSREDLWTGGTEELSKYSSSIRVSGAYRSIFASVLKAKNGEKISQYYAENVSTELMTMRRCALSEESDETIKSFYEKAYLDVKHMLKIYLGIDEDTLSKLDDMTQGELEVMFEEAFYE